MSRGTLAGNAYPVTIVGSGDITVTSVGEGLDAATVLPARLMSPYNVMTVNGAVSDVIDKRGWASVGVVIAGDFVEDSVLRVQVSTDGNPANFATLMDTANDAPFEMTLVAGEPNALVLWAEIFPFPYVRLLFVDATGADEDQTDLLVQYSLIS